jgi:tetratricopeptide (TPR) repeat protein
VTKNVNSIQSEIEDSIQRQDIEKSEKHIRTLLKTDKYSVDSRLLASEYYRRLSLYVRSMQVLQCNKDPIDLDHPSVSDVRLYLQYARLRNSLGGSKFALLIINKLKINQKIQFSKLVGPILLSNYKYQDAYPIYKKVDSELSDHSDYPTRVHYLGLIDTLTGLKDYKNATDCLNRIEQISKEPLLKGILCEIRGSILLMTGNYKEALNVLNSALNYFPENTKTVDLGYLYTFLFLFLPL